MTRPWEADFARLEAMLPAFAPLQESLMDSAVELLRCLQLRDETGTSVW